nr:helix-turn-helix transcriptional regulator [Tissierella sp.]
MDFYIAKFGKALRNIRKDLSLTLSKVTLLSGVNSETIRRIESGKVIPKFETLEFLSNVYKVDLNSLFLEYRVDDYSYFYEIKFRF